MEMKVTVIIEQEPRKEKEVIRREQKVRTVEEERTEEEVKTEKDVSSEEEGESEEETSTRKKEESEDVDRIEKAPETEEEASTRKKEESKDVDRIEKAPETEEEVSTEGKVETEDVKKVETFKSLREYLRNDLTIVYVLAHFLKDVFLGLWLSYASLFLINVLNIDVFHTTLLMTLGQCANILGIRIARRTNGSALRSLDFGFACLVCSVPILAFDFYEKNDPKKIITCGVVIFLFQLGTGLMQTSHTLVMPNFIKENKHRKNLGATRYFAQINQKMCGYIILGTIFFFFEYSRKAIEPKDSSLRMFQAIIFIIWLTGIISYCLFRKLIKFYGKEDRISMGLEPPDNDTTMDLDDSENKSTTEYRTYHFLVATMYCLMKVHVTMYLIYLPQWLVERAAVLKRDEEGMECKTCSNMDIIVNAPSLFCLFSLIGTCVSTGYSKKKKGDLSKLGMIICVIASNYLLFINPTHGKDYVFTFSVLTGYGSSMALVSIGFKASEIIHRYRNQIEHQLLIYAEIFIVAVLTQVVAYGKFNHDHYYQMVLFWMCWSTSTLSLCISVFIRYAY